MQMGAEMSRPEVQDLQNKRRVGCLFEWQSGHATLHFLSGAHSAGDRRLTKSVSGGMILHGRPLEKGLDKTTKRRSRHRMCVLATVRQSSRWESTHLSEDLANPLAHQLKCGAVTSKPSSWKSGTATHDRFANANCPFLFASDPLSCLALGASGSSLRHGMIICDCWPRNSRCWPGFRFSRPERVRCCCHSCWGFQRAHAQWEVKSKRQRSCTLGSSLHENTHRFEAGRTLECFQGAYLVANDERHRQVFMPVITGAPVAMPEDASVMVVVRCCQEVVWDKESNITKKSKSKLSTQ